MTKIIKYLARKTALLFVWLVFIFILLQGAGYIYFNVLNLKAIGEHGYPHGLFVPHDDLDYLYTPNYVSHFSGGAFHDIEVAINSTGFRDGETDFAPQRKRIVFLGDSVVFGAGASKEDRFTEQFEKSRWAVGHKVDAVNMGVNSYSFAHYLTIAEKDFFGTKPDYVVVGFTLNDLATKESAWPARRHGRLKALDESSKPDWLSYMQKLLGKTYAGEFTRELQAHFKALSMDPGEAKEYHTKWMKSVDRAWHDDEQTQRLYKEIDRFKATLLLSNTPYMFLLFPELNTLLYPEEFSYPRQEIKRFLAAEGITVCDAYDAFAKAKDVTALFLPGDSVHFTQLGHKTVSDVLQRCLQ